MSLTFGFATARDVLAKAYRDFDRLKLAADAQSEEAIADAIFNFAVTVFHVQDWLKATPGMRVRPHEVEALVRRSTSLSAFHDLCTAHKHKEITRYTPSTSSVHASATAQTSTGLDPEGPVVFRKRFVTKVVRADSTRHEAIALAAEALQTW